MMRIEPLLEIHDLDALAAEPKVLGQVIEAVLVRSLEKAAPDADPQAYRRWFGSQSDAICERMKLAMEIIAHHPETVELKNPPDLTDEEARASARGFGVLLQVLAAGKLLEWGYQFRGSTCRLDIIEEEIDGLWTHKAIQVVEQEEG